MHGASAFASAQHPPLFHRCPRCLLLGGAGAGAGDGVANVKASGEPETGVLLTVDDGAYGDGEAARWKGNVRINAWRW